MNTACGIQTNIPRDQWYRWHISSCLLPAAVS